MISIVNFIFQIQRDAKIGKIPAHQATGQCVEILTALKKLGDSLTPEEEAYLQANSSTSLKEFEQVSSTLGTSCFWIIYAVD